MSPLHFALAALGAIGLLKLGSAVMRPRIPLPVTRGLSVGDSLTANGGYTQVLRQRTNAPWDIAAESGYNSERILGLARQALSDPSKRYSHVVVLAGINDGNRNPSWTTRNLQQIYQLARAHGAVVIAVAELPWLGYASAGQREVARHQGARAWVLSGQAGSGVFPVDAYSVLSQPGRPGYLRSDLDARDHLHLNSDGQRLLGETIARLLSR